MTGLSNSFHIIPSKYKKWKAAAGNNSTDPYSFGVIIATCKSFEVLDKGGSCEEAQQAWHGMGLTGFMAGAAAKMISHYHVRGEEFRKYWNTKWGVSESKAKGGVVNPAIVELKD